MELIVNINRTDFVEFNKFVFYKWKLKRSILFASFFIVLWVVILNFDKPFDLGLIFKEILIFSFFWALLMFIIYQASFLKIKKMPDDKGSILGNKRYLIQEEGIREISENSESYTNWKGIIKTMESDKYFFIFVDKVAAYVIPKIFFKDKNEENKFIEIIKSKTKKLRK